MPVYQKYIKVVQKKAPEQSTTQSQPAPQTTKQSSPPKNPRVLRSPNLPLPKQYEEPSDAFPYFCGCNQNSYKNYRALATHLYSFH